MTRLSAARVTFNGIGSSWVGFLKLGARDLVRLNFDGSNLL